MRLHLDHTPQQPGFNITHNQGIFLIGSCFSTNIGALLNDHRFKVFSNPGGILFNPLSISEGLQAILKQEKADEKLMLEREGVFYHFRCHSSVHAASKNELSALISETTTKSLEFLKSCNYLILTFGTAFYYHHIALNTVVANCHKQPGKLFEKKLAGVEQILGQYHILLNQLKEVNPQLKIIFTVSPVKHLKDGLVENNISKSTLILAIHELIRSHHQCSYFPAFELVNDDLRDYRFYKEDMAHPNEQAIQYVWEKFSDCYFGPATQQLNQKIKQLNQALSHRPLSSNQEEQVKFQAFISKLKEEIVQQFPAIEF